MQRRPKVLEGKTPRFMTGCGWIYVTLNTNKKELFEVLPTIGKSGGCAQAQVEAIGRIVSVALQNNAPVNDIVKQLSGISCHAPSGIGDEKITSCADAIARSLRLHQEELNSKEKV
jgi:ribonucleoside-diphosphate reductase alpha chain